MLFSILIANYNNGHFFKDCYKSILSQTYANWEVIIVDDCSTDDSVAVMKQIIGDDNRFKIFFNNENKGCGYTKNKSAELASGEICGFLDPDDALKNDALESMVALHKQFEDVAIITSKYELVDLEMNFIENGSHGEGIPVNKSYLTYGKAAFTAFATFKQKKYLQSGGIDAKMKRAVDQDLYYKMEEQGQHLFVDKVLYRYRIHINSISNNENLFKAKYWHFYAMKKAYKRRKLAQLKNDNLSKQYIDEYASDYYLGRFITVKHTRKYSAKFYFLLKAILASPTHKIELKIKSLILLTLGRI
ncbi:glycosyltransferase family 2 protein [Flavobacterium sp. W22_SRS_FP1]|uniref:glycosyltransferase family 2 protein n=1 Tax=Flavobacterium sp. W22_SRS_FP1 TaxID=3240276 RepID=UPI003F93838E